jgi:hypothetical protein
MKKTEFRNKYGRGGSWAFWDPADVRDLSVIGRYWDKRKPHYVLVGLNLSKSVEYTWGNFHHSPRDAKLGYAISRTKYRGAYMTDIIKRIIEPNSAELMKSLTEKEKRKHVQKFENELRSLGCKNRMIIALGGDTYKLLCKYLGPGFKIKQVMHYSARHDPIFHDKIEYARRVKADLQKPYVRTALNLSHRG